MYDFHYYEDREMVLPYRASDSGIDPRRVHYKLKLAGEIYPVVYAKAREFSGCRDLYFYGGKIHELPPKEA